MDSNKRYCQMRVSKRKKQPGKGNWCVLNEVVSPTSVEVTIILPTVLMLVLN